MGRVVFKKFDEGYFEGKVVSYLYPYYRVEYSDGDAEDMSEAELFELFCGKQMGRTAAKKALSRPPAWQVQGGDVGNSFGGLRPQLIEVECESVRDGPTNSRNFFMELFSKDRVLILKQKIGSKKRWSKPAVRFDQFGCTYELCGSKVCDDGRNFRGQMDKCIEYVYVAVRGPGLTDISLQGALENIGDFRGMTPRKIASRFELFFSPAKSEVPPQRLSLQDFTIIDEPMSFVTNSPMTDGCGFIGDDIVARVLGQAAVAKTIALQVRIFGPHMGVWK
ncbi:unnamed protein product, partial [Symbiodinium microadriaticum]